MFPASIERADETFSTRHKFVTAVIYEYQLDCDKFFIFIPCNYKFMCWVIDFVDSLTLHTKSGEPRTNSLTNNSAGDYQAVGRYREKISH